MVPTEYVAQATLLGVPCVLAFWGICARARPLRVGWAFAGAALTSALALTVLWLVALQPNGASVEIESLADGDHVHGPWTTVTGTVAPPGMRVTVLVHAKDDPHWWVQHEATVVGNAWTCKARIGTDSAGAEEYFQLQAVASAAPAIADAVWCRHMPGGAPRRRPPPLPGSPVVTIWRAE